MSETTQTITKMLKIKKYLKDTGITEPLRKRIEHVHSYIQRIFPCKIKDIFITDYIKEDGTHIYEHLDFFTDKFIITARDFVERVDIVFGSHRKQVLLVSFKTKDYDFREASDSSRLNVSLTYNIPYLRGELKATGRNCDYLMKYVSEYFLPSLRD
jgi:hypothetical protein